MFAYASRRSLVAPLGLAVVAIAAAVALLAVGEIQYQEQSERFITNATLSTIHLGLFIVGLVATGAGFVLMRARPWPGAVVAAGGSIVAGLLLYWLIVPLVLAALVAAYAIRRARRIADAASRE